jgi:uncharacterized membrane protein YfcA
VTPLGALAGAIVGYVLGLVGGGGSILAVPLLLQLVGVTSVHAAIGTSAIAVAGSALVNLVPHWRAGHIKWRCALVFSAAGVVGAFAGSSLAKAIDGHQLLILFAALMVVVGLSMLLPRRRPGEPGVRLTRATALRLTPRLAGTGLAVGALSGFFGIGGGFLIVPGLMLATDMPMAFAVGTSLVAVFAFGATTAANYALSGLVDWPLAAVFVAGAAVGGAGGALTGRFLTARRDLLRYAFAAIVVAAGGWIAYTTLAPA